MKQSDADMRMWIDIFAGVDLGPELFFRIFNARKRVDRLHSLQVMQIACDWRVAIENTLEAAHVPFIHPTSIAKLGLQSRRMSKHGLNSMEEFDITDARALKQMNAFAKYFEDVDPTTYFHIYIYPYTCVSSAGGFTYSIQQYFPTETGTVLLTRLYSSRVRSGSPDLGFFFDNAAKFNRQVFQEDATMCEKVRRIRCEGQEMKPHLKRLEWFWEARRDDQSSAT